MAGVLGKLSHAAGIESPTWTGLRTFVRFALLFLIERSLLVLLSMRHDVVYDLGALCRALPVRARRVALRACAGENIDLLAHGFSEARHEGLEVAETSTGHAGRGGTREFGRVARLITLELGELGLALRDAALASAEPLGLASLLGVRDALDYL
jgi:hypothetical protein